MSCSLLCLRQECIFVVCSFQNIPNFFHMKFPSWFSETWNLTKNSVDGKPGWRWLFCSFRGPSALGGSAMILAGEPFNSKIIAEEWLPISMTTLSKKFFGQFIRNPARQKKTNSTWCCAGAERFSALFVALRVWAKFLFLVRLSGEHIIAIMIIIPISNQWWPCRHYQITTTRTTNTNTTITNKWRSTTWSCSALIINSSRVCFGFLSELGEINIFKIFRLSSSW